MSDDELSADKIVTARPRWGGAILVCSKCIRRHDAGKDLQRALKGHVKAATAPGARKVRIIKTACLGLCPKRAVVLASPVTLARGEVVVARAKGDIAGALARLLPDHRVFSR